MDHREIIYRRYAEKFQSSGYQRADLVVHWTRAYRWYFRRWLPTDPAAAIFDAGCGGGQMLQVLKNLGFSAAQGVDGSEQQVRRAQSAGLEVRRGDAIEALRESPARWDLILAIDVWEHLRKDEALDFMLAAHAALKPGGRLVLQMPNPDARAGMKVRYGDLTHEIALGPDGAQRLLELFGFERVEARELGPVPRFGCRLGPLRWALWQLCRAWWMTLDVIETGGSPGRVHTRVYAISACRPETRS